MLRCGSATASGSQQNNQTSVSWQTKTKMSTTIMKFESWAGLGAWNALIYIVTLSPGREEWPVHTSPLLWINLKKQKARDWAETKQELLEVQVKFLFYLLFPELSRSSVTGVLVGLDTLYQLDVSTFLRVRCKKHEKLWWYEVFVQMAGNSVVDVSRCDKLVRAVRLMAFVTTAIEERAGFYSLKARATNDGGYLLGEETSDRGAWGENDDTSGVNEYLDVSTHSERSPSHSLRRGIVGTNVRASLRVKHCESAVRRNPKQERCVRTLVNNNHTLEKTLEVKKNRHLPHRCFLCQSWLTGL